MLFERYLNMDSVEIVYVEDLNCFMCLDFVWMDFLGLGFVRDFVRLVFLRDFVRLDMLDCL